MDEASLITMNELSSCIDLNRLDQIKDRETLRKKVHQYYSFLCERFPENISWDGKTFIYKEEYYDHFRYRDECYDSRLSSLSFNDSKGLLEFTPTIFPENGRQKTLELMFSRIRDSKADMVFPIDPLKIIVLFLDVRELSYIY